MKRKLVLSAISKYVVEASGSSARGPHMSGTTTDALASAGAALEPDPADQQGEALEPPQPLPTWWLFVLGSWVPPQAIFWTVIQTIIVPVRVAELVRAAPAPHAFHGHQCLIVHVRTTCNGNILEFVIGFRSSCNATQQSVYYIPSRLHDLA